MDPSFAIIRACVALFYSGIFWMMVMFIVENRQAAPQDRKPLVPLAVVLMIGSVYLMMGIVVHQDVAAPPLDQPAMTSATIEAVREQ